MRFSAAALLATFVTLAGSLPSCSSSSGADAPESPETTVSGSAAIATGCRSFVLTTPGGVTNGDDAKNDGSRVDTHTPARIAIPSSLTAGVSLAVSDDQGNSATCVYSLQGKWLQGNRRTSVACTTVGYPRSLTAGSQIVVTHLALGAAPGIVASATIPEIIDDGNPCTEDICDFRTGVRHDLRPAGAVCPDQLACNGLEACDGAGRCLPGAPPSVDDGDPCTSDTCSEPVGVQNVYDSALCTRPPSPPPQPGDGTVPGDFGSGISFLFQGGNPRQTGVSPGTIDLSRAAVIRGYTVKSNTAQASGEELLPGVRVSIVNHPEFGATSSQADGSFDLVVNGGEVYLVQFELTDSLTVQRTARTRWHDYTVLPHVALTPQAGLMTMRGGGTTVVMGAGNLQVLAGTPVTDGDGTRTPVLMIPPGTMTSWGNTSPSTITVRATEYTVGPTGERAMPGELPPGSAYTYAIEFGVDAAGATRVEFNQPILSYTESFTGFPLRPGGTHVPAGYYDRSSGAWIAGDSGQVIKILGVDGAGQAQVDVDGDGVADSDPKFGKYDAKGTLVAVSMGDAERAELAARYPVGAVLWRLPITHFTPWDQNWGYGPPPGAGFPGGGALNDGKDLKDPCKRSGSIIECQNQILAEQIGIVGTPFDLRYQSERQRGRRVTIDIPIVGPNPPATPPDSIVVNIFVAGRYFRIPIAYQGANQWYHWSGWDKTDSNGLVVTGVKWVHVDIGYVYQGSSKYTDTTRFGGLDSDQSITGNRAAKQITYWRAYNTQVGTFDAKGLGFGGWSLTDHHVYDPQNQVFYGGDGSRRTATAYIAEVAWAAADLGTPTDVIAAPDGSVYVAEYLKIQKVARDGTATDFASGLGMNPSGGLAFARDGSLYFAQRMTYQGAPAGVYKVAKSGGKPQLVVAANTGPLATPTGLATGLDGGLYIASEGFPNRVVRLAPDGSLSVVAGGATSSGPYFGDGGLAVNAEIRGMGGIAVGPDGQIYIADVDNAVCRVRVVGPDGILRSVAGRVGVGCAAGSDAGSYVDGIKATDARFVFPSALQVGPDGTLYILDFGQNVVRAVGSDGIIRRIAGAGTYSKPQDCAPYGGPATATCFGIPRSLTISPDGALYIGDRQTHSLLRVRSELPGSSISEISVPSEAGDAIHVFAPSGRHLRTIDALRGVTLVSFGYDANGLVTSVRDRDGNVTAIDRSAPGIVRIRAPFGEETALTLATGQTDTTLNGYLQSVTNPNGESVQLAYYGGLQAGLLSQLTDPKGQQHLFTYWGDGRLATDADPALGATMLARTSAWGSGYAVSFVTPLQRVTNYTVDAIPSNPQPPGETPGERRTVTAPDGTRSTLDKTDQAKWISTAADGTVTATQHVPDWRFGMASPYAGTTTITTPSGLTQTVTEKRTGTLANPPNALPLASLSATTSINDANHTYTALIDLVANQMTTTSPEGRTVTKTLDAKNRVTSIAVATRAPIRFTYNDTPCAPPGPSTPTGCGGRLVSVVQTSATDGARSSYDNYDYSPDTGFESTSLDSLGNATSFARDAVGRVQRTTLPDFLTSIGVGYDANGNVTTLTPPGQPSHALAYNTFDAVSSYTPPPVPGATGSTTYAYDGDRSPQGVFTPDGNITFAYDAAGRTAALSYPADRLTFAYDDAGHTGHLLSIANGAGSIRYGFDGGLLSTVTWRYPVFAAPMTVTRTYDRGANGQSFFELDAIAVDGVSTAFAYDRDGVLKSAQTGSGPAFLITPEPATGAAAATAIGVVTSTFARNGFGETKQDTTTANGRTVYDVGYLRDVAGRVTQKTETIGGVTTTTAYTYDPKLGWLTREGQGPTHLFDGNGNRTQRDGTTVAQYDAQDRLEWFQRLDGTTNQYAYTPGGALATKTNGGSITTYNYDVVGNLRGVAMPDGTQIAYAIDAESRRIGKYVNGTLVQGLVYQRALWPIAETDGSGSVARVFIYGTRDNVPDYAYSVSSGVSYRILSDLVGSPRLVVNAASGAIAERIDYDAWGNIQADSVLEPGFTPIPFGFAGGIHDRDTKLVRFGARDYDPEVGRWTDKDPLGFGGGDSDLYKYAYNDPVNHVDPNGEDPTFKARYAMYTRMISAAVGVVVGMGIHAPSDTSCHPANVFGMLTVVGGMGALSTTATTAESVVVTIPRVTANRANGNAYRDYLAGLLRQAGREVEKEVYYWTPFGKRFIDIEVREAGRVLGGIETKVGGSPYKVLQRLKDFYLKSAKGYSVDISRVPTNWK